MRLIDADRVTRLIESIPAYEFKKSNWIADEQMGIICGNCSEPTVWRTRFCPYCGSVMLNNEENKDEN